MYHIYEIETLKNYNLQKQVSKEYNVIDNFYNFDFSVSLLVNEFDEVVIFQYDSKTNYIDIADGDEQYKRIKDIVVGIKKVENDYKIIVAKEELYVS
ncbi:MAG: hypothetical protein Ta2D_10170 [Rickettsiales bacterium]|nr:MAG: hypothetical protein Ta2D_10170 [Rickettsiales bacterium]